MFTIPAGVASETTTQPVYAFTSTIATLRTAINCVICACDNHDIILSLFHATENIHNREWNIRRTFASVCNIKHLVWAEQGVRQQNVIISISDKSTELSATIHTTQSPLTLNCSDEGHLLRVTGVVVEEDVPDSGVEELNERWADHWPLHSNSVCVLYSVPQSM